MRIFFTRSFARFVKREEIAAKRLQDAVRRAESGLIDANLGGGVIKQRIAREGEGKSGGYRSLILFKAGDRAIFAYGFAKNAQDNIDRSELAALRKLAARLLSLDEGELAKAVREAALQELD